jgi:hypothetical protein
MSRGFQAVLTAACFAFATLMAPPVIGVSEAQAATTIKSSKSNSSDRKRKGIKAGSGPAARATTVKSSKSNTSDRMGGGGGKGSAGRATTVKSSKSNSSDRMGGGGGRGGAVFGPMGTGFPGR